jgi:hypothetical protein
VTTAEAIALLREWNDEVTDPDVHGAVVEGIDSLEAEIERLTKERDELVRRGVNALTERDEARAEIERLRAAMEAAQNELGVPGDNYPAPVANAVEILRTALEDEDDVGPPAPGEGLDLENPEIGMVC